MPTLDSSHELALRRSPGFQLTLAFLYFVSSVGHFYGDSTSRRHYFENASECSRHDGKLLDAIVVLRRLLSLQRLMRLIRASPAPGPKSSPQAEEQMRPISMRNHCNFIYALFPLYHWKPD